MALPSVLQQSVLQVLDNQSRVAAATCCKQLHTEALQPFSWKYGQLVTITYTTHPELLTFSEDPRPWSFFRNHPLPKNIVSVSCAVIGRPGMPNVEHVQQLIFGSTLVAQDVRTALSLSHQTSVHLALSSKKYGPLTPNVVRDFASHTQLTELSLIGGGLHHIDSIMTLPGHLLRLYLDCFPFHTNAFTALLQAPFAAQLQYLSLKGEIGAITCKSFRSILKALRQLRELRMSTYLSQYGDFNHLLCEVPHAPALQTRGIDYGGALRPTMDILQYILAASPALHIQLAMEHYVGHNDPCAQLARVTARALDVRKDSAKINLSHPTLQKTTRG